MQTYALQTYINLLGYSCSVVDYRNSTFRHARRILHPHQKWKEFVFRLLNAGIIHARHKEFEQFRHKQLSLSRLFTEKNICEANRQYDLFVFGSDQVWNPRLTGGDANYFGRFADAGKICISYAASMGDYGLTIEKLSLFGSDLQHFEALAVRDEQTAQLVTALTGRTATVVMDPVFLLDSVRWRSLVQNGDNGGKPHKGTYIFLYTLQGKKTGLLKYANYLSQVTGLKVIEFQSWVKLKSEHVTKRYVDDPNAFLRLIDNAEYVITDSFHCTAFSLIFHKKFWVKIPDGALLNNTRIGSLLTTVNLQDRLIPNDPSVWRWSAEIDETVVDHIIEENTEFSKLYLQTVLTGKKASIHE